MSVNEHRPEIRGESRKVGVTQAERGRKIMAEDAGKMFPCQT